MVTAGVSHPGIAVHQDTPLSFVGNLGTPEGYLATHSLQAPCCLLYAEGLTKKNVIDIVYLKLELFIFFSF